MSELAPTCGNNWINVGSKRLPKMLPRRDIRVTYTDGTSMETSINGTETEILDYYRGPFNTGYMGEDYFQTVQKLEFTDVDVPKEVAI